MVGFNLRPYGSGQAKMMAPSQSLEDCQTKCIGETTFTCGAVNYQVTEMQCQLLERYDSTGYAPQSRPSYQYSLRPVCGATGMN